MPDARSEPASSVDARHAVCDQQSSLRLPAFVRKRRCAFNPGVLFLHRLSAFRRSISVIHYLRESRWNMHGIWNECSEEAGDMRQVISRSAS